MSKKKSIIRKGFYILVSVLAIIIVLPIAAFFLGIFLHTLADNDSYSSKDGSFQVLNPGCPAINNPNGSDFNWSKIKSNKMMENCLFELAYNLETPEKMEDWLKKEGFDNVKKHSRWRSYPDNVNRTYVNAIWEGHEMPYFSNNNIFSRFVNSGFAHSYSAQIVYENGTLSYVSFIALVL